MQPVDQLEAERLGTVAGGLPPVGLEQDADEALLLLLFGVAAIEDAEQRQIIALAAGMKIYSHTRHCQDSLARYMSATLHQARLGHRHTLAPL